MGKLLDAAMAALDSECNQKPAFRVFSAVRSVALKAEEVKGTKGTGEEDEKQQGDQLAPALPALVQAVLDQWPGAEIVAVRRGVERDFKPLTYAEASAQVTASLPPPKKMTRAWARMMWVHDFGRTRFY